MLEWARTWWKRRKRIKETGRKEGDKGIFPGGAKYCLQIEGGDRRVT